MNPRLLDMLVKEDLLTSDQAQKAVVDQRRSGERLATVLTRLGFITEEELLDFLSRKYGIPVINLGRVEADPDILRLVRKEIVQKYQVFPVRKVGNTLTLALADPTVVLAIDDIQFATGLHVIPVLAAESAIRAAIDHNYSSGVDDIKKLIDQESTGGETNLELVDKGSKVDITELGREAEEAPTIRLVNLIIADAIRKRASDIHLEPGEKAFSVRYRIDGVLHDTIQPPKQMEPAILSRVKIMANMDIAERRLPQDGRMSVKFQNREIDLRVSSLPTIFGESIVMRVLDKGGSSWTWPGSGSRKTTSCGSRRPSDALRDDPGDRADGKREEHHALRGHRDHQQARHQIITAEDPVEYNLPGVKQVHVREDIGYNFSAALRSFLRQDPDVVLVGEMRDIETAQIAIRAALTGHLVFSTLHTNDAPSTVTRLQDMGIPPFLISSSLLLVVAQRLVRRKLPGVPGGGPGAGVRPDRHRLPARRGRERAGLRRQGVRGLREHRVQGPDLHPRDHVDGPRAAGSHHPPAARQRAEGDRREGGDADPAADRAPEGGERAHHDRRGPPRDVRRLRAKGEQT